MKIRIRKSAIKDLKRISPEQKKKIQLKVLALKDFPDVANVKKLTNFEPAYRLRTGIIAFYLMLWMIVLRLAGYFIERKVINRF